MFTWMKSAPWYRAVSKDYSVFSGRMDDRPRWAMFNGLPYCLIYLAGLGIAKQ